MIPTEEWFRKLEKALKVGGSVYAPSDILDALRSGQMQAIWNEDGTVITEIAEFPRTRYLTAVIALGKLDAVLALQPQLVALAKQSGCRYIIGAGRRGWTPFLKELGWKHIWHGFRYDIED